MIRRHVIADLSRSNCFPVRPGLAPQAETVSRQDSLRGVHHRRLRGDESEVRIVGCLLSGQRARASLSSAVVSGTKCSHPGLSDCFHRSLPPRRLCHQTTKMA